MVTIRRLSEIKRSALLPAILATTLTATSAWAQQQGQPVVHSQLQKVEATIQAINPDTREVTLKGPRGPVTFAVGSEAKNFDQLHVGDKVVMSYYEGIAAQMSKAGQKVTEPAVSTFSYPAEGGKKPGGGVGQSVTTSVTIEDVDRGTNTVAFRRPDGTVHIVAVKSPNMQQFIHTLKPGDSVDVTYTESVAVNVIRLAAK
jgi:hypothetical protein